MIYDAQNLFFWKKALAATNTSDVVYVGEGEAANPLYVVVNTSGAEGAALECKVQTSATEDFTSPTTIATLNGTTKLSAALPRGNKGYLRLVVDSEKTGGTITAGLVPDADINW